MSNMENVEPAAFGRVFVQDTESLVQHKLEIAHAILLLAAMLPTSGRGPPVPRLLISGKMLISDKKSRADLRLPGDRGPKERERHTTAARLATSVVRPLRRLARVK